MLTLHQWDKSSSEDTPVSGRHLEFSREESQRRELPRSLHGSPVDEALPEAQAERVEVELAPAVVAQELPLLLVLPQREARVRLLQEVRGGSPPERREERA